MCPEAKRANPDASLIGRDGIASIYAGPEQAKASAAAIVGPDGDRGV